MLVLIQVSSMNTRRFGSRRSCKLRQRCRRRATSARPCSRANSVFFEAETFAPQEGPYRIVRDFHASRGKFVLQPVQREMWRLPDPLHDECPMRLQNRLTVTAHL